MTGARDEPDRAGPGGAHDEPSRAGLGDARDEPDRRLGGAHDEPSRAGLGDAPALAEICVVACAQAWRGDGAILASPMGLIPTLAARLARLTFEPDLLLTDGEATLLAPCGESRAGDREPGERDCWTG